MDKVIRFGPGQQLAGVLTGPPLPQARPLLLLPSAGLQPRCGPFRLHVELGERLAQHGIRSFRFDLPGVGEAPRLNGCDGRAATLAAIDRLQELEGCADFAVGGICSAADVGWQAAVVDARVSALLMLDGIAFTGPWFHYARAINRLRRLPREWRGMLRRAPDRLRGSDGLGSADFREWPSHADARREFAQLVARDVQQLWIYSGGYTDRFLHPRQFNWAFGAPARSPQVAMHYWPDCDHTYFARAHRDRLLAAVEDWMTRLPTRLGGRP